MEDCWVTIIFVAMVSGDKVVESDGGTIRNRLKKKSNMKRVK